MVVRNVSAASLILDFNIYPRQDFSRQRVNYYSEAMEAGAVFPPIVVDESSYRVVDGWHRLKAVQKFGGEDALIRTDFQVFNSEAELFLEAMRLNAANAQPLSREDQVHCIVVGEQLGLSREQITGTLSLPDHRYSELKVTRVATQGQGLTPAAQIPLKRTTRHWAGQRLTPTQITYNEKAGGLPQTYFVRQVIFMLESDADDKNDAALQELLRRLFELLEQKLTTKP